jgi:pimeloyl-ACP methyl ester carboxylesterase
MSAHTIVVLHGANGSAREIEALAAPLRAFGRVLVPDLPGHGGRPVPPRITLQDICGEVLALLDREGVERAFIVGYSLGGYAALYLARHHPARVLGACSIATKFVLDPETIKRWVYLAQPERLERPGNPRAGELAALHGTEWRAVTLANAAYFEDLGRAPPLDEADLAAIDRPVLLVNSNRDSLVAWEETLHLGKVIPGARLVMFYGLAHPLRNVPVGRVGEAIGQWMKEAVPA